MSLLAQRLNKTNSAQSEFAKREAYLLSLKNDNSIDVSKVDSERVQYETDGKDFQVYAQSMSNDNETIGYYVREINAKRISKAKAIAQFNDAIWSNR